MADDHGLIVENDVMIPMRDGVSLRADVFRPATAGPHPVLVQRYPYSPRDGIMAMFGRQIAQQGYAVIVQSCRGRFGSEGDFTPFQPDVADSYDTVEWAAAQPWSERQGGHVRRLVQRHDPVDRGHREAAAPRLHRTCHLHLGLDRRWLVLLARRAHPRPRAALECTNDCLRGGAAWPAGARGGIRRSCQDHG